MQKKREQFISCRTNDNHQYRKYFTTRRQVMELFVYFFYLYDFAFILNLCKLRTPMPSCTSIECADHERPYCKGEGKRVK